MTARIEGYWRTRYAPDLPMPVPDVEWPGRTELLAALDRVEARVGRLHMKGWSRCRLCGEPNGSVEYDAGTWRWPAGLRHYLADHGVRPSTDFEAFVLALDSRIQTAGRTA